MTSFKDLPKHPLERPMTCPVCQTEFKTIPLKRGLHVNDFSHIVEHHTCPKGHVYQTEVGKNEMLA